MYKKNGNFCHWKQSNEYDGILKSLWIPEFFLLLFSHFHLAPLAEFMGFITHQKSILKIQKYTPVGYVVVDV